MKIKRKYFILLVIIILTSLPLIYKDIIFQEGNPLPILKGIIKLNNSNTYVEIYNNPVTYLTKTNKKNELFEYIEKENSVKFKEQFGSGYIFESNDKNIIITSRQYTRFYKIWFYSEQNIKD